MSFLNFQSGLAPEYDDLEAEFAKKFNLPPRSNWSDRELYAYDRYMDSIRSSASQYETAILEEKLMIAQDLLDVLDVATIAKKTRLTVEQVEELKNRAK
jgi:hypothetical protein